MPRSIPLVLPAAFAVCALLSAAVPAHATQVWSGRTLSFTKADFADWTLPANQDRITDSVWITRASSQGPFNAVGELGYDTGSPAGTEWADGNAVDHDSLTFVPWVDWAIHFPPGTVARDAVVHLIAEDIYLDIQVTSWTTRGLGGGFSYVRAEPPTSGVTPTRTARFSLRGFVTNPVANAATIEFTLPDAAPARLQVFDVAGRLLASRDVGGMGAGVHRVQFSELGSRPAGLLFARLSRGSASVTARGTTLR